MSDNITFLKELQKELQTQDKDVQASPRFWVLMDYRIVICGTGYGHDTHILLPNHDYRSCEIDELLSELEGELKDEDQFDLTKDDIAAFDAIEFDFDALDWIKEHYDEDATLVEVKEESFIVPNTLFLTKQDAKDHMISNNYHYTSKVHTYAMTAWRSPKVATLLNILEQFNWDEIKDGNHDEN